MIGVLRADLLKIRKRWLFWVLLLILTVLMGLAAVFLLLLPSIDPDAIPGMPVFETPDAIVLGAQQAIGQTWFPLILAVVFLGTEVAGPVWASELSRESRRWMHLVSRLVILTLASWLAMLLATAGWALLAVLFTEGGSPAAGEWWAIVWKAGVIQLTWVALGLGAIALVRSTGIAIGIALAFSFFEGLGALWEPYREVSLTIASTSMLGDLGAEMAGGFGFAFGGSMTVGHALAVAVGWAALGLVLAYVGLERREP